jgi:NADH-quinone oxidoreductase subunit I
LIFEKQDLLAPMQAGMAAAPHAMVEGTTEKDYYLGKVSRATDAQIAEVAARAARANTAEVEK